MTVKMLNVYFKAMNRSLTSVILGGFGNKSVKFNAQAAIGGTHTETNVDQVVDLMVNSKSIIITPGETEKIKDLINYYYYYQIFC